MSASVGFDLAVLLEKAMKLFQDLHWEQRKLEQNLGAETRQHFLPVGLRPENQLLDHNLRVAVGMFEIVEFAVVESNLDGQLPVPLAVVESRVAQMEFVHILRGALDQEEALLGAKDQYSDRINWIGVGGRH
jgi:hypothetical protein